MDEPRAAATSATTRPNAPNPPVITIVLPRIPASYASERRDSARFIHSKHAQAAKD